MGDHYCCKACGQRYDLCTCSPEPEGTRVEPTKKKPKRMTVRQQRQAAKKEKSVLQNVETPIRELDDFSLPLKDLALIIAGLIQKYGPEARIYCDAGYNNVSVIVVHRPMVFATLDTLPDVAVTGEVSLTVGKRYAVREDWGSGNVLIDTDIPQVTCIVHQNRLSNIGKGEDA